MKKGKIAKKEPLMTEMQPATYYWCSCGKSSNQRLVSINTPSLTV